MKHLYLKKILLSTLSGLLLSIGWTQLPIAWICFIAFIPLLQLLDLQLSSKSKLASFHFLLYCLNSFIIWNALSTWWIYYATLPGAIAAIVLSSIMMATVMLFVFIVYRKFGKKIGLFAFVVFWTAFEYLFLNSQINWPWLILGNAFANNISLIQWYEFTGHLGGSVWILLCNVLIYNLLLQIINKKLEIKKSLIPLLLVIFLPISYSLYRYYTYEEKNNPIDIVVIQPSVDPYNEKFDMPTTQQLLEFNNLAAAVSDTNVEYFIAPETAMPDGVWEEQILDYEGIIFLQDFLKNYPKSKYIIGAATRKYYHNGINKTSTAQRFAKTPDYYDLFNTSLQFDTSKNVYFYHKSKLVPGVEQMPYPEIFGFLQELMINLGGMSGSHGTQTERTVFHNDNNNINVGVPICYESVFGEFMTEFVQKGAQLIFIITNDGWWQDTPGYKQHCNFAKLRAIETRRSIARSANTGISCFINQKGEIIKSLNWYEKAAIREKLNANDNITFYVKYGDYIAKMALISSLLLIGGLFAMIIKNKTNKVKLNKDNMA